MARKDVAAIVSGAGWIADFAGQFICGLKERGCSDEQIHSLVTSKGKLPMAKIIAEVYQEIRGKLIITPPAGGRIHIVSVSSVDESRPWDQAVRAAGPSTPETYPVWRVGDQYPPQQFKGSQEVILVNFGRYISSENVLAWGKEQKLRPASPRTCFAVAEHCSNLFYDLILEWMTIVSLVKCSFEDRQQVCGVSWGRSGCEANLYWFDRFDHGWSGDCWFTFVRE